MEIRRLKHLVALADTRNFGRAAQQCHLSQPAFSRSIQAAEDELGLQLFDRGSTEVRCTDAGAFVVERARKLVFDNHCLERDVSLYRERQMGDIAIGVGPYPAATLLPVLLTDMRTRFPAVHVRVEVNNANYLADHLRAEELDFYVADLRNIPATSDLEVTRIGQLTASFYVRKGHPLLNQTSVQGKALLPYGLASVRVPEKILLLLASLMGLPQDVRLPLAIECDDLNLLKTVAMATDTVVACADAGALEEVADGRLVRLTTSDIPTQFSDLGVVSLKGRSYSPMAQYAVDFLAMLGLQQTRP
ncbi:LysR family transcriptional regulator [Rhodoferax sp. AJA081-3]|uniref:LysR family transcriptional regulator n=1 Tax=Rhodoferax sp. AJA081-3 TaxID=2752316 RepID=UPI001ADFE20A|nr:LysR family transcriptional regulator [Rhodoferax sp. AJA081-3]QTN27184.1 LysR family transcriptional regulator [Rhodoferax sp. AJA081-3]